MTATITPDSMATNLVVNSPTARRQQYEAALRHYSKAAAGILDGIVFAENSGADLSSFGAHMTSDIQFEAVSTGKISSRPGDGRGYQETMLVLRAMGQSSLLQDSIAIKVTGRYKVQNLAAIVKSMDQNRDCGFNFRRYPTDWVDMAVYFANQNAMNSIGARIERLREGREHISAERRLGAVLDEAEHEGISIQRRFHAEPRIHGVRGLDGRKYQDLRQSAKWAVRTVSKRLLPSLWI